MLSSNQVLAVHFHEDFIDVKGVAVALMLSFQSTCINGTKFDTPETDRFPADRDTPLCEEIFNISMAVTTRLRLKR